MNNTNYPIPILMSDLPVDSRGYPIPYFVPIVNGKPDFRYQDHKKRDVCLKHKKCSVCGNALFHKSFWFISGPLGLANKVASDAPMHEDCARYSLNVCPHLIFYKAERRSEGNGVPGQIREKPENIFLVKADQVNVIIRQGHKYIKFRPILSEQYKYEDNKLIPT